jgi:HPt (histidine-containing phosphotransfer) domain-containing protein
MNADFSKLSQPAELTEIADRPAETERGARAHERPPPPEAVEPPPADVFDLAEGIARSLGKYDLFRQMVGFFYQEADPLRDRMRAAVAEGDSDDLVYAVHRLKGTILYLGSHPAMQSAERLERIGRSGDLAPAAEALRDLERWIELLKSALASHRPDSEG